MRIIAGRWKGHRLKNLEGRHVRPTTDRIREAWMNILGGDLTGLRVLDLFAGSGALGLETLSRGAVEVVFVERSARALRTLNANVELLGAGDRCRVVKSDAVKYVERLQGIAFDVALADPPYGRRYASRLLRIFRGDPFARELWVEHRTDEALPELPGIRHRRYGDTTLTTLDAEACEPEQHQPTASTPTPDP